MLSFIQLVLHPPRPRLFAPSVAPRSSPRSPPFKARSTQALPMPCGSPTFAARQHKYAPSIPVRPCHTRRARPRSDEPRSDRTGPEPLLPWTVNHQYYDRVNPCCPQVAPSRSLTFSPSDLAPSRTVTLRAGRISALSVSHSSIIYRSNLAPSCSGTVSPSYILTSSHCLAPSRCLAPSHCMCHAPSLGHVIFAVGNTIKSSRKVAHTTYHANSSPLNISVIPHSAQFGSSSLSLNLNPLVN